MEKSAVRDLLKFQIRKSIISLSKDFLVSLEEIANKSYNLDYKKYRKLVLDKSNDRLRELDEFIDRIGDNI